MGEKCFPWNCFCCVHKTKGKQVAKKTEMENAEREGDMKLHADGLNFIN